MTLYLDIHQKLLHRFNTNETFGFFVSGGFDSALLLYFSNKIKNDNDLPCKFKVFTVPRTDDSAVHALRVVNWIKQSFTIDSDLVEVGDPTVHHSSQVSSGFNEALSQCHVIVLGDTKNPDELGQLPYAPKRGTSKVFPLFQPFFDITKKDTILLARNLGIVDQLAEISHSCTESTTLRCTKCWQCQERAWAFQQNGLTDIGTM